MFIKVTDATKAGDGTPLRLAINRICWYLPQPVDETPQSTLAPSVKARIHIDTGTDNLGIIFTQESVREIDKLLAVQQNPGLGVIPSASPRQLEAARLDGIEARADA